MIENMIQENDMVLPGAGLDLRGTLFCGQTFSWEEVSSKEVRLEEANLKEVRSEEANLKEANIQGLSPSGPVCEGFEGFVGVAKEYSVLAFMQVLQNKKVLVIRNLDGRPGDTKSLAFWEDYFSIDTDYEALKASFCEDATLNECVMAAPGIRVLRQPFFETLLSFIISQNNHIKRIYGIVKRLRELYGEALPGGQFAFPKATKLAGLGVQDLAPLRAGFRGKYIIDAAKKVASGQIQEEALYAMSTDQGRDTLMQIMGVGPKVADCVLLFSLNKREVVPMDVWMKRAMAQLFPMGMPRCAQGSEGIAQQFIYAYARAHL